MHQDQDIGIKFYSDCVVLVQRELAASNSNLVDEVNKGKFREDLFFRFNVLTLKIPPLRDRLSDIPHLVDRLMQILTQEYKQKNSLSRNNTCSG